MPQCSDSAGFGSGDSALTKLGFCSSIVWAGLTGTALDCITIACWAVLLVCMSGCRGCVGECKESKLIKYSGEYILGVVRSSTTDQQRPLGTDR